MAEQTFHTPSFGDEDFDIPAMHSHQQQQQHSQTQQQHHQQSQQQQQHDHMHHAYQSQMMPGMQQSPDGLSLDPGGYQQPLYLQQEHPMQPINVSSTYSSPQSSYTTMSSPSNQQQMLLMQQQQQQQQHQQQMQHMQYLQHTQHLQQQQQQQQQQMQYSRGQPTSGSPPAMQGALPEGTTTSEDSDDSTPHSAMITGIKRPSPEPTDTLSKAQKKPKAQKKKKKRDPNEPQKPVSAYALFFRDTQAAIKSQNSNASFGEVSKIVASMWDALDAEHKDVYKKKTEAAKKEYLKALAAYRASLVQKGDDQPQQQQQQAAAAAAAAAAQQQQHHQHQQQQQQHHTQHQGPTVQQVNLAQKQQQQAHQQQQQVQYASYGAPYGQGAPSGAQSAYQVYQQQQQQPPSPQQQQMQQTIKKSPHHLSPNSHTQHMQQQSLMGNPMPPPHMQQQHMQQQVSQQQQYMQQVSSQQVQVQQQQQQQILHMSPVKAEFKQEFKNEPLSSPPPVSGGQVSAAAMAQLQQPTNSCIRHGCPNAAIPNVEWEDEYCSNECVVSHCRDVFNTWVPTNQNPQQNFSTVK